MTNLNKGDKTYSFTKKNDSGVNSSILSIATAGLFLALIIAINFAFDAIPKFIGDFHIQMFLICLLYTSDAADDANVV